MPLNAKLSIETACRNGRTFLRASYCTQPFKLANVTEDKTGACLRLMVMSSSPGVLDGDSYEIDITVGAGCQVTLETQAYQRLFQMKGGASQRMDVRMAKGSSLCYLPHPVVPHRQAIYRSESNIYLDDECSLLWSEVLCCGRSQNGEVFAFSSLHSVTRIFKNGKLVVKENLLVQPSVTDPSGMGQLEGYTHQATLLYLDENVDTHVITDQVVARLKKHPHIIFGVTALPVNGVLVRLLGYKAETLFLAVKMVVGMLKKEPLFPPLKPEAYVL